jgi:hypothetical protein
MLVREVYQQQSGQAIEFSDWSSLEEFLKAYNDQTGLLYQYPSALRSIYKALQKEGMSWCHPTAPERIAGTHSLTLEVSHNQTTDKYYLSLWNKPENPSPQHRFDLRHLHLMATTMGAEVLTTRPAIVIGTEPLGLEHYLFEFDQLLRALYNIPGLTDFQTPFKVAEFLRRYILEFGKDRPVKDFNHLIATNGIVAQDELVKLYFLIGGSVGAHSVHHQRSAVVYGTTLRGLIDPYYETDEGEAKLPTLTLYIVSRDEIHLGETSITSDPTIARRQAQVAQLALLNLGRLVYQPEAAAIAAD